MMVSSSRLLCAPARRYLSTSNAASTIPVPPGKWPFVGHLPRLLQGGDPLKNWSEMHEECGDVFAVTVPPGKDIFVTRDPVHARTILMNQGRDTFRTPQDSWRKVFDQEGWPWGIPFAQGSDWKRRRKVLAETLLQAKNAKEYVPAVLPAANRYVDCLSAHLNKDGRLENTSIRELMGMFTLEAVMKVVIGVDFEALTTPISQDAKNFAKVIENMFTSTSKVENFPLHMRFETKPYQELRYAWQEMYRYPSETLQPALDHYKEHGKLPAECDGTVLPKLMEEYEQGHLSLDEILGIATQAIVAAVDTSAQTFEYLLYNLAKNPDVQERLYVESIATVGTAPELDMTIDEYSSLEYLPAVLRESMRMTPTVGVHARTLTNDVDLNGDYSIPKGKLVLINYYQMTRNPDIYPEPHLFLPERFLKGPPPSTAEEKHVNGCPMHHAAKKDAIQNGKAVVNDPFAAIPFGHGGRKCTGKGFAEMAVHLGLKALVRQYRVEYDGPDLVQHERSLLRPKSPLSPHLSFISRR